MRSLPLLLATALTLAPCTPINAATQVDPISADALGPFGQLGAATATTRIPQAPVARLINSGLAQTTDGAWVRWREIWKGAEVTGLESFERVDAKSDVRTWNLPTTERPDVTLPDMLPGETGCRLIAAVITGGRRLGAWGCESYPGTLLGAPSKSGELVILARLSKRFQDMAPGSMPHTDASRVTLVAYDPCSSQFDMLELSWPQAR